MAADTSDHISSRKYCLIREKAFGIFMSYIISTAQKTFAFERMVTRNPEQDYTMSSNIAS